MAYLSPLTAVAELRECCAELNTTPCQTILAYPGTLHYSAMTNCTAWELRALRSSRICGAFLHGEIAAAEEHNQVYVGADTLFGLTESEHDYLPIDQTLLDRFYRDWMPTGTTSINIWNMHSSKQRFPLLPDRSCSRRSCFAAIHF